MNYIGPGDEAKISRAIKSSGLTDREIAQKMGISVSSANAYRYGNRKPSAGRLSRLARVLNVDVRELLKEVN
jgi:transcriptional regulator with XRE-family HTH domain